MTPDIGNALFTMIQVLDELDIRYALVGGLAIGAWGVNRSTRDVDLYADLASENARQRRKSLEIKMNQRGFDIPAMEAELEEFGVFRARSAEGVFVDVFNAVGPLGEAILTRRRRIDMTGHSLWLIAPEDLAILKAFSERERDFDDLRNLAAVMGSKLDLKYIQEWARQLDASIGGHDVSERISLAFANQRRTKKSTKTSRKKSP